MMSFETFLLAFLIASTMGFAVMIGFLIWLLRKINEASTELMEREENWKWLDR
jgi:flagellar biogenesis protein FliO